MWEHVSRLGSSLDLLYYHDQLQGTRRIKSEPLYPASRSMLSTRRTHLRYLCPYCFADLASITNCSKLKTFGAGLETPASKRASGESTQEIAEQFIMSHLGISPSAFAFNKAFDGDVTGHAFFKQKFVSILTSDVMLFSPDS